MIPPPQVTFKQRVNPMNITQFYRPVFHLLFISDSKWKLQHVRCEIKKTVRRKKCRVAHINTFIAYINFPSPRLFPCIFHSRARNSSWYMCDSDEWCATRKPIFWISMSFHFFIIWLMLSDLTHLYLSVLTSNDYHLTVSGNIYYARREINLIYSCDDFLYEYNVKT